MKEFANLIQDMKDVNVLNKYRGMIGIRKIVSINENPAIQTVIEAGLVPLIIKYIKQKKYPQLQF
jgi:hypothetical protein